MKKLLVWLLIAVMALSCASALADVGDFDPELVKAAQEDGELVVYGSCEEPYLIAACKHFEELFGINRALHARIDGLHVKISNT